MDEDASQYLAYQLELENEHQELIELETFYNFFLGNDYEPDHTNN